VDARDPVAHDADVGLTDLADAYIDNGPACEK
jgi:hypothetical protein